MKTLVRSVVGIASLVLVVATASAQTQTGEIFGRVTDSTGAVLPGATVTISSTALIQPQTAAASVSGSYRFPNLPIGVYQVTFELQGFQRVIHDEVRIQAGFNAEVNGRLQLSTVEETVTVTGESPIVDTKSSTLGTNFGKELLEAIPSARDPWVILEQTPGMVMNVQNVGGNQSGQQASFAAHGSSANQQWNMDGGTITDMAAGSSPTYFDFDSFEEIQITTAGGDASQEASGVAINFITKTGGNQFRGSGRLFDANKQFQSSNTPEEVAAQGGGAGNPLKNVIEYGTEMGGPIRKDKAWFWGAINRQSIKVGVLGFLKAGAPADSIDADDLETDETVLNNQNLKLNYQWASPHKTTFLYSRGDKVRNARGASSTTRLESTTRQTGPTNFYKLDHQWVMTDRLMLNAMTSFNDAGFKLDFHKDELATVQRLLFVDQGTNGTLTRSGTFSNNIRPQYETRLDGNYFIPNFLGGDHSTKFGVRYRSSPYETISQTGGGVTARIRASGVNEVDVTRNGDTNREMWEYSAYFNDSWRIKRATLGLGLRFDHQDDRAMAANIAANPLLPDLLPAVSFAGADSDATFNDLSPRLSLTYDVFGNARTVAKVSANRYFGLGIYTAGTISPTGQTTLGYFWNDLNGDLFVTRDEINFARGFRTTPTSNYDPANPSAFNTPNTVDPDLENDITDEFLLGVDHEVMSDFALGVSYIKRKYHNFQDTFRNGVTSSLYSPVTITRPCGNLLCDDPTHTVTYFQRATALPAASTLRNYNAYRNYDGIELTARKRFSNNWLMNSSFTFNKTIINYPTIEDFSTTADPTNYQQQNGQDSSGLNGARWVLKLSGMYALPWQMAISGFYNAREGLQYNRLFRSPTRTGAGGTVDVFVEPQGSTHYPNFHQLDVSWSKFVSFGQRRVTFNVDAFNLTNAATVLGRTTRQDSSQANFATTILAPRVVRFGVKVNF